MYHINEYRIDCMISVGGFLGWANILPKYCLLRGFGVLKQTAFYKNKLLCKALINYDIIMTDNH